MSKATALTSDSGTTRTGLFRFDGRALHRVDGQAPVPAIAEFIHGQLRALVEHPNFSCLGAKAAFNKKTYWFALYDKLASPQTTEQLLHDLWAWGKDREKMETNFTTFITSYLEPDISSEAEFELKLWQQLQQLHNLDAEVFDWDPTVSGDPDDPQFSFSVGEKSFFIVGLHPAASRFARRFAYPTLVFNAHEQFENLRTEGKFDGLQTAIRTRERSLQGDINVNLANYGDASEARQYSGRPVSKDWRPIFDRHPRPNERSRCPFHHQTDDDTPDAGQDE